jgi:hypothetical protein
VCVSSTSQGIAFGRKNLTWGEGQEPGAAQRDKQLCRGLCGGAPSGGHCQRGNAGVAVDHLAGTCGTWLMWRQLGAKEHQLSLHLRVNTRHMRTGVCVVQQGSQDLRTLFPLRLIMTVAASFIAGQVLVIKGHFALDSGKKECLDFISAIAENLGVNRAACCFFCGGRVPEPGFFSGSQELRAASQGGTQVS